MYVKKKHEVHTLKIAAPNEFIICAIDSFFFPLVTLLSCTWAQSGCLACADQL